MKNILLILIVSISITGLRGQTYSSETADSEIMAFMNWFSKHQERVPDDHRRIRKHISSQILRWDSTYFMTGDQNQYSSVFEADDLFIFPEEWQTDSIFPQRDRAYLRKQFAAIHDTVWHRRFTGAARFRGIGKHTSDVYYYSIPLLTLDRKYVVVRYAFECDFLCGTGAVLIYERVDHKTWNLKTRVAIWYT